METALRSVRCSLRIDDAAAHLERLHPRGNGYRDLVDAMPLPDVKVTAAGSSGTRFLAISDQSGAYSFAHLPADLYGIEVKLPDGLVSRETQGYRPDRADLQNHSTREAGCRVDWFPSPDGRITRDDNARSRRPARGFLDIKYLDHPKVPGESTDMGPGYDVNNRTGKFELRGIFPGRLVLEFTATGSRQTVLWPDGNGINLVLGQHLDHVRIVVGHQ